jgi:hypothetical protein
MENAAQTIEENLPNCSWSNEMKSQYNSAKTDSDKEKFMEIYKGSSYENCPECSGKNIGCKAYQRLLKFL